MRLFVAVLAIGLVTTAANADTIALWTFESSTLPVSPATTTGMSVGPFSADVGSGSATGVHASASTAWNTVAGNGSIKALNSTYWASGDYYQFQVSTVGYTSIQISWDQTSSNTGPRDFKLQYSTDGTNFTDLVAGYTVLANGNTGLPTRSAWSTTGTRQAAYTFAYAAPAAVNGQANVYFRLADYTTTSANGNTVQSGGTDRIDNVLVEGVPEPLTMALLGVGGLAVLRRRRK